MLRCVGFLKTQQTLDEGQRVRNTNHLVVVKPQQHRPRPTQAAVHKCPAVILDLID